MQAQFANFINHFQAYLPMMREYSVIILAIILLFMIWALKSAILRQNRRFLRELKQEWHKQNQAPKSTQTTSSDHVKANLIEQKIAVHQALINLKADRTVELQNAGETGLSAQRHYQYFKDFRDIVINNRFYLPQETEFVFSQMMQDNATILLKLKHFENEFIELNNEAPTDRYALEQLTEQENLALNEFHQASQAEMERFLEMLENDALQLRAELAN